MAESDLEKSSNITDLILCTHITQGLTFPRKYIILLFGLQTTFLILTNSPKEIVMRV